ncbi:hypothetical protein [Streptomyces flavidovirens]|uniref:Uncharacterized protein n=1 Tax=Streptomyces flavidovirens TaxID=67298 RepID=A0ABW6RQX1_9ACTN
MEGGKLLARVEQPLRYAGDIDLKMLKTILERLERGRGLFAADIVSHDSINALRTAYEDMLALLLSSLQRSHIQLPNKLRYAFNQVIRELRNSSIPNPTAIAALVTVPPAPTHPGRHGTEERGRSEARPGSGGRCRSERPAHRSSTPHRPPRKPAPEGASGKRKSVRRSADRRRRADSMTTSE